jgi:hypothetical protein
MNFASTWRHDEHDDGGPERDALEEHRGRIDGVETPIRARNDGFGRGQREKRVAEDGRKDANRVARHVRTIGPSAERLGEQHEHAEDQHGDFERDGWDDLLHGLANLRGGGGWC